MQFGKGLKTKGGVGGKTCGKDKGFTASQFYKFFLSCILYFLHYLYQYRKIYNICIYKIYTGKDQSQLQQVSIKVENSVKN